MSNINNRVKELRESLELNQESFGDAIGLSKSGISNIENGIRNVTEKHIKLICHEYPVNENWLRYGKGEMFKTIPADELDRLAERYRLNPLAKKIVECFVTLEEHEMGAVLKLVKNIASATIDEISVTKENIIEKEVEAYRLELEAEKKGKTSLVSEDIEGIKEVQVK